MTHNYEEIELPALPEPHMVVNRGLLHDPKYHWNAFTADQMRDYARAAVAAALAAITPQSGTAPASLASGITSQSGGGVHEAPEGFEIDLLLADIQAWADKWALACIKDCAGPELMRDQARMKDKWQADLRAMLAAAPKPAASEQADHTPASAEHEAQVDAALGLRELPPIRVPVELADALQANADRYGVILQAAARQVLEWWAATKEGGPRQSLLADKPDRPTEPGWYVVLPPDFDEPTVRAFGKDGQWWIPLGKGNGDEGWMVGREYVNWVGPIADIADDQPFLATRRNRRNL